MKKLFIILSLFLFAVTAQAKTVNISDYGAIPDDNVDDTQAVRGAVDKLKASGGGTIIFPEGTIDISGSIDFQTSGNYQSYRLMGDRGSFIRLSGTGATDYFIFGNSNQVEFAGLIFYAPQSTIVNASRVIVSNYTILTTITNCAFFGIGANISVIDAYNTDLLIEKTQFEGTAAHQGVIRAITPNGVSVSNTTFIDYSNFLNMHLSKTAYIWSLAWINVENSTTTDGATGQRVVRIRDSRFDEGAVNAIRVRNQKNVEISGINVNVSGITGSAGIYFDNVEYSEIKYSVFGFPREPRPAIQLKKSSIEVTALSFNDSVYFIQRDKPSTFTVKSCTKCITPL